MERAVVFLYMVDVYNKEKFIAIVDSRQVCIVCNHKYLAYYNSYLIIEMLLILYI